MTLEICNIVMYLVYVCPQFTLEKKLKPHSSHIIYYYPMDSMNVCSVKWLKKHIATLMDLETTKTNPTFNLIV